MKIERGPVTKISIGRGLVVKANAKSTHFTIKWILIKNLKTLPFI